MMNSKIWLITGVSSGLGEALAHAAIQQGDFVIGTFRENEQVEKFNRHYGGKAMGMVMDMAQPDSLHHAVAKIKSQFGHVDVLINNAGVGFGGGVEEASLSEARMVFEVNFFGALHLTQLILPLMRNQKQGNIILISSHGGVKASAGFGIYNASKFALEGIGEALAAEAAPLGIKVTLVEPGPFRTNFAGASFHKANTTIGDYEKTAGAFIARMAQVNGRQEGDPAKAAAAIVKLVAEPEPPLRMPLGKIALVTLQSKIDSIQRDLNNGRAVAESVVFEE